MKKILMLIVTLGVLMTAAVMAAESGYGAVLGGESSEGGYTVTVTADNEQGGEYSAVLAAAVYEGERLLSLKWETVTVPAGESFIHSVSTSYNKDTQYVKGFFWEQKAARPLAAALDSRTYVAPEPPKEDDKAVLIPLSAANVWATDRQDDHGIAAMFDGSKDTYLAGQPRTGAPLYIYADLGGVYELSTLKLGFHSSGNKRSYAFDVFASLDGESYAMALEDQHSPRESDLPVDYPLSGRAAHLKIAVYGYDNENNSWDDNGWARISHLALYGSPAEDSRIYAMNEDFEGKTGRLSASASNINWFAYALDEETYTNYTPAIGSDLMAEYGKINGSTALHIHDNADRANGNGRGAVGAFRKLSVPADGADYTVNFKLFITENSENIYWSGLSLLSQAVTGGADLSAAAALQLRFTSGSHGGVTVNVLDSVQYNEGSPRQAFDGEFSLGTPWDVTLRVSPEGKRADITIDDGVTRETRTIGYNYTDVERVNNQTWSNAAVQYIAFNSGAGGKLDMYVDDFTLFHYSETAVSQIVYEQDFESISSLEEAGIEQAVVWKNADGTTGGSSIGSNLQATLAESGTFGGHVLKLTDTTGTDGLVVAVPLTLPDNNHEYIIKWKMRDFKPRNYSGISLASGFNRGMTDTEHPMALQMRYSMQDSNSKIQFNSYHSTRFNDGDFVGFMAMGGSRLRADAALEFEIKVNPLTHMMDISVSDGTTTVKSTHAFETTASYGGSESWNGKRVDTLLFHTGAGGESDCIIDNIQVIDTGIEAAYSDGAIMGIVRLESVFGTGRYLTLNSDGRITNSEGIDPDRTRFAERPGLADPKGVSLESVDHPGWFLYAEETHDVNHEFVLTLRQLDGTAQDKAFATFYKQTADDDDYYHGTQMLYAPIWDTNRCINYDGGKNVEFAVSRPSSERSGRFYVRSEAVNFVSDNFKGNSLNSQWHNNYPWKAANPTNDSYNFTALIDHRNIEVSDGRLLLKATKINDWPTDLSGATGINYNGKYGKGWLRWAGRVGVISSKKVFYRESLISGSFKQPDCSTGYWNAFWLNAASGWPPETDIFEYMSSHGTDTWYTATHRQSGGSEVGYGGWQKVSGINLRSGYHTFTLDWGYDYMRFYVDGTLYREIKGADVDEQNKGVQLILNTGIGGWEAEPDENTVWNTGMECQWIRSFKY